jgi:hypothetical protein
MKKIPVNCLESSFRLGWRIIVFFLSSLEPFFNAVALINFPGLLHLLFIVRKFSKSREISQLKGV